MVLGTKISQLADRAEVGRISGLTLAAAAKLPCAAHTTARARARSDGDVVRRRELGMALGGVQPQDPPRLRIRRPAALQALRAAPRWVPTRDPSRAPRHDPGPTAPPATLPQPDTPSPRVNPVPYLVSLPVPYLTDVKGFTNAQVTSDIFPVSVYASLAFYLVAGPVSAALGLKSFLVLGALCKLCTRAILIWGSSIHAMRLMQVLFAAGAASDLILFAYLYADPNESAPAQTDVAYRAATGAVSAASLGAYTVAAELGQLAFDAGASYESLFYVSFVSVGLGVVAGAALPSASASAGKARGDRASSSSAARDCVPSSSSFSRALARAWTRTRACYASSAVKALSLWWVLGTAPWYFVENYGTNLFDAVNPDADANGHVTFFARGLMAVAAAAAAMAPARVAASPWTYAAASVATGAAAAAMGSASTEAGAAIAYCAALASTQCAACLAYAQTALASDAHAARYAATEAEDEYEGERVAGSNPGSSDASARDAHAFLFGANGALSLFALVALQAIVDLTRVDVRAQMRVAAVVCFVAAGGTLVAAGVRKVAGASWGFRPETRDGGAGAGTTSDGDGGRLLARGETSSA